MGNLLRSLVGENPRQWDLVLPQVEFAYNRSHSRTTGNTPFEVVNGVNPITPLDLTPLTSHKHVSSAGEDYARQIQQLHEQVREHIEKHNTKYKDRVNRRRKQLIFKEGDLVWIRLGKECFPAGRLIKLPGEYNVSGTFNLADLSPYVTDEESSELKETKNLQQDSRMNLLLAGEYDDMGIQWNN
ncbi:RNA-directed DNA polymerase [Tanacetum coccineum]